MLFLRKIFYHFSLSQALIALAAAGMSMMHEHAYSKSVSLELALFTFCGTFVLYNAHRYVGLRLKPSLAAIERFEYVRNNSSWLMTISIIAIIYCTYFLFANLHLLRNTLIISSFVVGAFYVIPTISKKRIRDISYLKIFLIAFIWSVLTVFIPLENIWKNDEFKFIFLQQALFIFAITLPFDIRDLSVDREEGVKTIAGILGINTSKTLAISILIIATMTSFYVSNNWISYSFLFINALSAFLIYKTEESKSEIYFLGYFDGLMLLYPIFYLTFYLIK